jgi:hypothetical protein
VDTPPPANSLESSIPNKKAVVNNLTDAVIDGGHFETVEKTIQLTSMANSYKSFGPRQKNFNGIETKAWSSLKKEELG